MDCNPLFACLKSIVKWMMKYFAKLFIVNEIRIILVRIGIKSIFYSYITEKLQNLRKK